MTAGAGLDVFEDEINIHEGLVRNEGAMLLLRCGMWTKKTQSKMEE